MEAITTKIYCRIGKGITNVNISAMMYIKTPA
jgi:hypothetical protein